MRKKPPPQHLLKELFDYSGSSRGLIYKQMDVSRFSRLEIGKLRNAKWANKKAGSKFSLRRGNKARYTSIKIDGKQHYEHVLVLAWHGVDIPEFKEVDHIDNDAILLIIGLSCLVGAIWIAINLLNALAYGI